LINDQYTSTVRLDEAFRFAVGSFIENVSYIYTIVSRSFQTSHSESGLNNSIRLGYCLAYISTTFEMSISMSLWTYNKIISPKWFMHISHLISVNIFLENFDTFFFVWSFSVMRFLRLLLKHLMSVRLILPHCTAERILYKS
jgi:hypothetical protein